jgi:hypothetical protein
MSAQAHTPPPRSERFPTEQELDEAVQRAAPG